MGQHENLTGLFSLEKQQGVPADEQRYWGRVIKEKRSLMFVLLQFLLILLYSPCLVLGTRAAAVLWGVWGMGSSGAGICDLLPAGILNLGVN